MDHESSLADSLSRCVAQLDSVLIPWGFTFQRDDITASHFGDYASGHYCRGATRIGLSCRHTIDNIYYEHTFVSQRYGVHEKEKYDIGHDGLMLGLGHASDCWLKYSLLDRRGPSALGTDDTVDVLHALVHDLQSFAAPALSQPNELFFAIIRTGRRCFSVDFDG